MKELKLKKGWLYLLGFINILIMMTLTNNSFVIDLLLLMIFGLNSKIMLKYGGLD